MDENLRIWIEEMTKEFGILPDKLSGIAELLRSRQDLHGLGIILAELAGDSRVLLGRLEYALSHWENASTKGEDHV